MQLRLSAAPVPKPEDGPEARTTPLSEGARGLFRRSVHRDSSTLERELREHPQPAEEFKTWFGQRGVLRDPVWRDLSRTTPPVGDAVRLARRTGSKLGGWRELSAYSSHAGVVQATGLPAGAPQQVAGRRVAWDGKMNEHYRGPLMPLRAQGFWQWRSIALGFHCAGIKKHSGTVPVERMWSLLEEMVRPMARTVSPWWCRLLAMLAVLRIACSRYSAGLAPPWAGGDMRLCESMENLTAVMKAISDVSEIGAIVSPFC